MKYMSMKQQCGCSGFQSEVERMGLRDCVWRTNSSPSNNTKCIVELSDGSYTIAWQKFGEWEDFLQSSIGYEHVDVVRWRFWEKEDVEWLRKFIADYCKRTSKKLIHLGGEI